MSSPHRSLHLVPRSSSSMDPRTFKPEFDVVNEIINNKDQYTGDSNFTTLYGIPHYVITSVRRVSQKINSRIGSRPGVGAIVSCCLSYGLGAFEGDPVIKGWLAIRSELDSVGDGTDIYSLEETSSSFSHFPITTPDAMCTGTTKLSMPIPEEIKLTLHSLASDIGISQSSLGVFSLMLALSTQPHVLPKMRELQGVAVKQLIGRVESKTKTAKVMIAML